MSVEDAIKRVSEVLDTVSVSGRDNIAKLNTAMNILDACLNAINTGKAAAVKSEEKPTGE